MGVGSLSVSKFLTCREDNKTLKANVRKHTSSTSVSVWGDADFDELMDSLESSWLSSAISKDGFFANIWSSMISSDNSFSLYGFNSRIDRYAKMAGISQKATQELIVNDMFSLIEENN